MTSDQEILYIVKADNKNAIAQFEALRKTQEGVTAQTRRLTGSTQQGNMMLMSTSRIIQDMPFGFMAVGNNITFLAEQFAYAKSQGTGFKDALKGIFTSLMGTGGVIFAISTAVSVITMLSMNTGKAKGEVQSLTQALKENWSEAYKARKEWEKFREELKKFSAEDLGESFKTLNKQIQDWNISVFTGMLAYLGLYDGLISKINEISTLTTQRSMVLSQFMTTTYDPDKTIERVKELLKVQKEITNEVIRMGRAGDATDRFRLGGDATIRGTAGTAGMIPSFVGGDSGGGVTGFTEEYKKQLELVENLTKDTANLMRSEFGSAWQDIFGEANSLFEKILMTWAARFSSDLIDAGANWLTSGFFGLLGGVLGFQPQTINVNMGNENVEKVVIKGLRGAQQKRLI